MYDKRSKAESRREYSCKIVDMELLIASEKKKLANLEREKEEKSTVPSNVSKKWVLKGVSSLYYALEISISSRVCVWVIKMPK